MRIGPGGTAVAMISSSPGCVLAATTIRRPFNTALRRFSSDSSQGRAAASSLRLRIGPGFMPNVLSRLTVSSSCGRIRSKRPSRSRAAAGRLAQPLAEDSVSRAETRASLAPLASAALIRLGQRSLSQSMARSGFQWAMKRATACGPSTGMYWWMTPAGKRLASSSAEVTVPLVTRIERPGRSARMRSIRVSSEIVSPTETPCSQTSWPSGRGSEARPSRSPIRAGSSLPLPARAPSTSGANGSNRPVPSR